ncbi:MAG: hypothetical protein QOC70_1729 [Verrucomicrobiota bacterium]|jgi:hypothetical protein
MKTLISHQIIPVIAAIEQAGVPALRGAFSIAALVVVLAGILIFRKRHQLFDRDPNVENDVREVRDDRIQLLVMVWGGLATLIIGVLIDVWRA